MDGGTLADLLNAPTEIEYKGTTFKLRQPTLMEQAQFQRWLEQRARDAVGRATDLDDDAQRKLARDVNTDIAVGVFEWGGEACARAVRTITGLTKLLSIILYDQAVTLEMAQEMIEHRLKEITAVLASKASSDPKALEAALTKLGLPSVTSSSPSATRRSRTRRPKSRR